MNDLRKNLASDKWRQSALLISIYVMLTGLLFSRAILSSGLIFFIVLCIIHKNISAQVKTFLSSVFLWSMSLLFFLPFISGLWSEDISNWSQIIRIKLPLCLLPFCLAGIDNFLKNWERIAFAFLILVLGGVCWSLWQYLKDAASVHAGYLKAHTIETPLGNDHIRFSLLVATAIVASTFLLVKKRKDLNKIIFIFLLIITIIDIIYLHVLAVRTGLICFYIASFTFITWLAWERKLKVKYILLFALMLLLPVISYFIFPTFKNRIKYLKYDLSFVQRNIYLPGSNDGNRFLSLKAGWQLQNQNPFIGVGFGDIKKETDSFYATNYPQMTEADKILPSSEWMMYGAGAGWPGFILFSFVAIIPFFVRRLKKNITWWLINVFFLLSYSFDIGLEVQYGIFIHAFILLWWYKWLCAEEIS